MSCIISISKRPEDIWGIRNTIYEWFVRLLSQRFSSDSSLIEALRQSEYYHALALDDIRSEDPILARRIADALLDMAREVADGRHALVDHYGKPWPELQANAEKAFSGLVELLIRFQQTTVAPSFDETG